MEEKLGSPTWAVALTAAEPAALVLANVAHHLATGAAEVFVFLDVENADLSRTLSAHPRVTVENCDADYWTRVNGRRPKLHTTRQKLNLAEVRTRCDWLLNIDADEFLWCEEEFTQILARVPDSKGWLKILTRERRRIAGRTPLDIFEGVFVAREGEALALTDGGFTGHVVGKSCVRMGRGYELRLHSPQQAGEEKWVPREVSQDAVLLHFDGLTPLHWASKLLLRAQLGPEMVRKNYHNKRRLQIVKAAQAVPDIAEIEALQTRLASVAEGADALEVDLDLARKVAFAFSDAKVDLSVASFDAIIRPRVDEMMTKVEPNDPEWEALAQTVLKREKG
ncbi:glycosyltransferase family 2 protein [Falsihalocynthiibacter sp. SS001]|uniref:glycosyltransferase family 2 protein n=1 Tax=Falsihalocynthiibacter sp. SS001 TaxID=3349698 RepID=UPI0036D218E4